MKKVGSYFMLILTLAVVSLLFSSSTQAKASNLDKMLLLERSHTKTKENLMVKEDIISSENIEEFDLEMVEITDPYYINAFEKDVEYLLRLNPNRLLVGFRAVLDGIDPGKANLFIKYGFRLYGGWEGGWSLLRGHSLGHYLTAMAQAYKQTKDTNLSLNEEIKEKLDYTINQLKSYQNKSKNGYLFASPEVHFDKSFW